MADYIDKGARISRCETYRFRLWRRWGDGTQVTFIMLNPSTADASEDDPTIRKCVGFADRWGHSAIEVVNLFAYRTPSPKALLDADGDKVGDKNDLFLLEACSRGKEVICAWGVHGGFRGRDRAVLELLDAYHLQCLGRTMKGHPRHPLYVPYAQKRELFEMT